MLIIVQFDGPDQNEVVAVFGSPQDPEIHGNLAEIEADDERLLKFYARAPEASYG